MSAFTKQDLLNTLADPTLHKISIICEGLSVSGAGFMLVRSLVETGQIKVVEGAKTNAYYNSSSNTITTQLGSSPPDAWGKALLIHECVHALADVYKSKITQLSEETFSYIVQYAFIQQSIPTYNVAHNPTMPTPNDEAQWQKFWGNLFAFVKSLGIDPSKPETKVLQSRDIAPLRSELNTLNIYRHLTVATSGGNDGVFKEYVPVIPMIPPM